MPPVQDVLACWLGCLTFGAESGMKIRWQEPAFLGPTCMVLGSDSIAKFILEMLNEVISEISNADSKSSYNWKTSFY